MLGGAVTGRYRGTSLRPVPLVHETWAAWLAAHPRTLVLSIRHDLYARRFLHPTVETTQRGEAPSDEPYSDYATKVPFYFGRRIEGLPGSALVLGLVVDGRPRAYPLVALRRRHAIDDGRLRIVYDDDAFAASAFLRRAGRLVRLPATLSYWFAWHAIYPDAALLDPGES